jgi:hypothetical protein
VRFRRALASATVGAVLLSAERYTGDDQSAPFNCPFRGYESSIEFRVIVAVNHVSRIAASLRMGRWNDEAAQVIPLEITDLGATVRSFGGCPVYGSEFIDPPEESWVQWRDRLSVDARLHQDESPMSLTCSRKAAAPRLATWTRASGSGRSRSPPLMAATSRCLSSSPRESAGGMDCTPAIPAPGSMAFSRSAAKGSISPMCAAAGITPRAAPSCARGFAGRRRALADSLSPPQTFPNTGPTAAQAGWKLGLSGPSALIMSCSAFES